MSIWTPGLEFLVLRMTEHGDKGFVSPIVDTFDEILQRNRRPRVFFDLEGMATYDSELRTQLTARFYDDRPRIAEFHVLVVSKLTAMGVSVANLALGGIITAHSSRAPFLLALDAAVAAAKVTGFSTSAAFASC